MNNEYTPDPEDDDDELDIFRCRACNQEAEMIQYGNDWPRCSECGAC